MLLLKHLITQIINYLLQIQVTPPPPPPPSNLMFLFYEVGPLTNCQ